MTTTDISCKPEKIYKILAVILIVFGWSYTLLRYSTSRTVKTGNLFISYQLYSDAVDILNPFYRYFSWDERIAHAYGRALMGTGRFDLAAAVLENSIGGRFNYMININLANCYEQMHDFTTAARIYDHVLKYASRQEQAREGYARCVVKETMKILYSMNDDVDPIVLDDLCHRLNQLTERKMKYPIVINTRLELLYLKGDNKGIKSHLKNTGYAETAGLWLKMLVIKSADRIKDWESILSIGEGIIESPDATPQMINRLFYELRKDQPAELDKRSRYHELMGNMYLKSGQTEKARNEFQVALKDDPDDPDLRALLENSSLTDAELTPVN
jgi:tetratricopeptide (TPR) repeat protein